MVPINIQNFVFSPYKIKSQFLFTIKFSINIFSPCKIFPSAFLIPVKNLTFLVPKMLKENVTGTEKCDFIL